MTTTDVANYKLNTQVGTVGDGTRAGWWVTAVDGDGTGTGPGVITVSNVQPI